MTRLTFDALAPRPVRPAHLALRVSPSFGVVSRTVVVVSTLRASVLWRRAAAAGATLTLLAATWLAATLLAPSALRAQKTMAITPYAGWLVTGSWLEGPLGTNVGNAGAPVVGAQLGIPLVPGVQLTGSLGYASGDLRVGVPVLGGIDIGTSRTWLYDGALEVGGLALTGGGVAPFASIGVGGMSHDVRSGPVSLQATNYAITGGAGVDIGLGNLALRLAAKDWYGRFDTQEAVGFDITRERTHNWQLSAGLRIGF